MSQDGKALTAHQHVENLEKTAVVVHVPVEDEDFRRVSRSVVRKLDMTLLPMVWILYLFNYIDRNNIRYVVDELSDNTGILTGLIE